VRRLTDQLRVPPEQLHDPLASLTTRADTCGHDGQRIELTPAGQADRDQLLAADREQLVFLLDGWQREQDEDLRPVLRRLAGALVVEMPGRRRGGAVSRLSEMEGILGRGCLEVVTLTP
jgi:hypothetical protein